MKKKDLYEFLDYWNQLDKAEGDYKPINPYQLGGIVLAPGFYLKWYLDKEEFLTLAKELDIEQEANDTGKILFRYSDQNVEIERKLWLVGNILNCSIYF